ncbi:restriction endonuclease subunit S [Pediococcus pentosaceus]|jgi:type I restriction enzyme S subunit
MFPENGKDIPRVKFNRFSGKWEQRKLGEITNIKTGASDLQDAVEGGLYPFFVRSENVKRSMRYIFDGEAILIPGEGKIGEIYHYINGKFDYHQRVYKISDFKKEQIDGKYILFYMKRNFKKHALRSSVKATVDSLRLPTLNNFPIIVPIYDEQKEISSIFSNLEDNILIFEMKLRSVHLVKKSLLQKMFI